MRIVFDHQIFGWQEYGGISRYFFELASELATTCGQDVKVLAPLYVNRYLARAPSALQVLGRPSPRLPKSGRFYRFVNSLLATPLWKGLQADIVHETYYASSRLAPSGAKVVLTVFDMIHERHKESFSTYDPISREKMRAVERADHVICISEQTRRDLIELFDVDPGKTSVVYLGFSLTSSPATRPCTIEPRRPFLLYVGKRGGYKNFAGLLRAYAASPWLKAEYDLICFGGSGFTPAERSLMRQLSLSAEQVRQVSGDDEVLEGYYRAARAFVFPSLYEGFGIPPLEAMSFDCPVVCSGVSSIPEVVGDAALLFEPTDTDAMGAAIETAVADQPLRQSLIERGRKRIENFSWGRCAEDTLRVYQQVLR